MLTHKFNTNVSRKLHYRKALVFQNQFVFRQKDGFPSVESLRLGGLLLRCLVTSLGLNLGNFTIVLPQLIGQRVTFSSIKHIIQLPSRIL